MHNLEHTTTLKLYNLTFSNLRDCVHQELQAWETTYIENVLLIITTFFGLIAVAPSPEAKTAGEINESVKLGLVSYAQAYLHNKFDVESVQQYNITGGIIMRLEPTGSTTLIKRDTLLETGLRFLAFGNMTGGVLTTPLQVILADSDLGVHFAVSDVYSHPEQLANAMVFSTNQTMFKRDTRVSWLSYNFNHFDSTYGQGWKDDESNVQYGNELASELDSWIPRNPSSKYCASAQWGDDNRDA